MYVVYLGTRAIGWFENFSDAAEFADMREGAEVALEDEGE